MIWFCPWLRRQPPIKPVLDSQLKCNGLMIEFQKMQLEHNDLTRKRIERLEEIVAAMKSEGRE